MYSTDTEPPLPTLQSELIRLAPYLGVLLLLLIISLGVFPLARRNVTVAREVSILEQESGTLQGLLSQGPQLQRQAELAEQQRQRTIARFAPPDILDRVLLDLVAQSNRLRNFELRSYNYRADGTRLVNDDRFGNVLKGQLLENTIELELAGDFSSTLTYLAGLERRNPRLVLSGYKSSLGQNETDQGRIITKVNATAISLLSQMPPAQAEKLRKRMEAQQP